MTKLLSIAVVLLLLLGGCSTGTDASFFITQKVTVTEYGKVTEIEGNCATSTVGTTFNVTCLSEDGEVAAIEEFDMADMLIPVSFESSENEHYHYSAHINPYEYGIM